MPSIEGLQKIGTVKVVLQRSTELLGEETWAVVKKAVQVKDLEDELEDINPEDLKTGKMRFKRGIQYLTTAIVDWNLTLKDQKAPITPENVGLLPSEDLAAMQTAMKEPTPLGDIKKKS